MRVGRSRCSDLGCGCRIQEFGVWGLGVQGFRVN